MREYGKVSPLFWAGRTGKALRKEPEAMLVALYLMTNQHSNMIGIYSLPIAYISNDTGIPSEGATKALARLVELDFCTYDKELDLVYVHEMAKYQIAEELAVGDNQVKGIKKELSRVVSPLMAAAFRVRYCKAFHLDLLEGDTSPSEAPPKPRTGAGTRADIKDKLTLVPGNSVPGESPPDSIEKKKSIPCPHLKVLALWAEVMPELAQPNVDLWEGQRADHLRARWRSLGALNEWASEDEGLADFEGAFRLARESEFLMGRTQRKDGKPSFALTLDWLVCPNNWTKFLERKYHKARAA